MTGPTASTGHGSSSTCRGTSCGGRTAASWPRRAVSTGSSVFAPARRASDVGAQRVALLVRDQDDVEQPVTGQALRSALDPVALLGRSVVGVLTGQRERMDECFRDRDP